MPRVLVVEDSATIAKYVEMSLLLESDIDVVLVTKGFAHLLDPICPSWIDVDVICCDLMLPDLTGWPILATAKEHHPNIGRLLFTAVPEIAEQQNQSLQLAQQIIGKGSTTGEELVTAIRAVLP